MALKRKKKNQAKAISLQSQPQQSSAFKAAWSYWRYPTRQRTCTLPFSLPNSPGVNRRNAASAASVEPELLLHLREGWMETEEQFKLLLQQHTKALQSWAQTPTGWTRTLSVPQSQQEKTLEGGLLLGVFSYKRSSSLLMSISSWQCDVHLSQQSSSNCLMWPAHKLCKGMIPSPVWVAFASHLFHCGVCINYKGPTICFEHFFFLNSDAKRAWNSAFQTQNAAMQVQGQGLSHPDLPRASPHSLCPGSSL